MTLEDQLLRDEGFRAKAYKDSVGKLTIGIGRNLEAVGISQEEAQFLLANDITQARANLAAAIPWTSRLDEIRLAALINMTFNMGIGGLLEFKNFLGLLEKGDYHGAAKEMVNSKWAEQVAARAWRLAVQIESGEWK